MEKLWKNMFKNELKFDPTDADILATEPPLNPKPIREKMTQLFFEKFKVSRFYIAIDGVLALYSTGRTTGIVVSSGDAVTYIVPCSEGYSLPHGIRRADMGGRDVTENLIKLLTERGYSFIRSADREIVKDIKAKLCYVSMDYNGDIGNDDSLSFDEEYELPDGKVITVGTERFRAPEIMFVPSLIGRSMSGIHRWVHDSINLCDGEFAFTELYSNIVLTGGNTMIKGFDDRLQKEMIALSPTSCKVGVVAPVERKYGSWIGGSVLSSLSTFEEMWITKDEYDEFGPGIVHRKCF